MYFLILGFFTGLSLILAIGAQNIFVMEQGLKKQYIFLVCLICSVSDLILIFLGIFLFEYFRVFFTKNVELIFNILLFIFLVHFIYNKIRSLYKTSEINFQNNKLSTKNIIFKTFGFTYLNPHVYSDTIFFLGNFSKNFLTQEKFLFGMGAGTSSFLFFFVIGYLSNYLSNFLKNQEVWKKINYLIIIFMFSLSLYVLKNIFF